MVKPTLFMMHHSLPASNITPVSSSPPFDIFAFDYIVPFLDDLEGDPPRRQQVNSQISILPPELLSIIFSQAIEDDPFHTPVILSHVSWLWRQTALSTPRLWRTIHVILPNPSPSLTFHRTNAWLSRSGLYPLDITLCVNQWSTGDGSINVLECLKQHACHWGRFVLKADAHDLSRLLFSYFMRDEDIWIPPPGHQRPQSFEMLSRLDLHVGVPRRYYNNDDSIIEHNPGDAQPQADIDYIFQSLIQVAPKRLRYLNMAVSAIPAFDYSLKPLSKLNLRTLQIFERSNVVFSTPIVSAAAFLNFVSLCPYLEVLTFRGSSLTYDPDIPPPHIDGCINLPSLRTLCISQTSHQCFILSYLAAPNLHTLRLFWLNQEGTGPLQDNDIFLHSGIIDPSVISSSSEEPTEFSQSPWTDILTGTGLRTFIFNSGNSLPFLKVLDMDFSDMRSPKDFKWVFSRIPALETFRMIGSDMSDNALNTLSAPVVISREDDHGKPDPEWLCPRLREVELSRCDVITGQAIMKLARARGGNSPLREKDESVSILERFDVDGCAKVDCTSVAIAKYLIDEEVCFDVKVEAGLNVFSERGICMPSLNITG